MTSDHDDLSRWPSFGRKVEPLPGGLADLRARMARDRRPSWRRMWVPATALVAVAAIAVLWLGRRPVEGQADQRAAAMFEQPGRLPHPAAISLGLAERPELAQVGDPRLTSHGNRKVVFQWVRARPGTIASTRRIAPVNADSLLWRPERSTSATPAQ